MILKGAFSGVYNLLYGLCSVNAIKSPGERTKRRENTKDSTRVQVKSIQLRAEVWLRIRTVECVAVKRETIRGWRVQYTVKCQIIDEVCENVLKDKSLL